VITSRRSALPEVAGNAAVFIKLRGADESDLGAQSRRDV
jgi:hypothetical protein